MDKKQTIDMDEVSAVVQNIIRAQARKNTFAEYTVEDIIQEIWVIVLEALEDYDPNRSLENFLSVCVKNRLKNLYRDQYHRREPPCPSCPYFDKKDKTCTIFTNDNKHECDKWANFQKNVWRRINIRRPKFLSELQVDFGENAKSNILDVYDMIHYVDNQIGTDAAVCLLHCVSGSISTIPIKYREQLQEVLDF